MVDWTAKKKEVTFFFGTRNPLDSFSFLLLSRFFFISYCENTLFCDRWKHMAGINKNSIHQFFGMIWFQLQASSSTLYPAGLF